MFGYTIIKKKELNDIHEGVNQISQKVISLAQKQEDDRKYLDMGKKAYALSLGSQKMVMVSQNFVSAGAVCELTGNVVAEKTPVKTEGEAA